MTSRSKVAKAKPRIFLRCGLWSVAWDGPDGQRYSRYQLYWMTANSVRSLAALKFAHDRNVAEERGPYATSL